MFLFVYWCFFSVVFGLFHGFFLCCFYLKVFLMVFNGFRWEWGKNQRGRLAKVVLWRYFSGLFFRVCVCCFFSIFGVSLVLFGCCLFFDVFVVVFCLQHVFIESDHGVYL